MNTLTYKDYTGSVNHSEKDNVFFGKIEGINALVNYEGDNIDELTNAFHEAVDDYLNYCKNAPIRNAAMIGFFENYPIKRVFRINDSLLLTGESDQLWAYISSESKDELKELLQKSVIGTKYFACLEDWMIPLVTKDAEVDWTLSTMHYILPETCSVEPPVRNVIELNTTFVDYIYYHSDYQAFISKDYIADRIKRGLSSGIIDDGKLVAWAITHDDNSLGFLHVIPEYRRNGYGTDVVKSLIIKKRKEHKSIYANIEPTNNNSLNLANRLGFIFDRNISWIKLK